MLFLLLFNLLLGGCHANPDAKRLYDDLLSNYNRLVRPVSNHTEQITVKLGVRLSQLVELVSLDITPGLFFERLHNLGKFWQHL